MRKNKRIILLLSLLFSLSAANAQLEVSHLSTKGFSSPGLGAFFNFGFSVNPGNVITYESGFIVFDHSAVVPSILMGYRHTFNGRGNGLYIEPQFTFTYGAADIPKRDSSEFPLLKRC
ncbi:MAG TPA: hypothetical protein VIH61_05755 [Waddliaceae bacterium]